MSYALLVVGALVPWLATYVETGRLPSTPEQSTSELITTVFILFLGYAGLSIIRKQNTLLQEQNQQLETQSRTDGLTGLYNHRSFLDALHAEVKSAELRGNQLSLAFLDLDGFKELNDTMGHVEGDRILREVAKLLRTHLGRATDWVFRYGGDEFAVIVPGKSSGQVAQMIEPLVGDLELTSSGRCSLSAGVAQWKRGMAAGDLVKISDSAMYRAKDNRQSRVVEA